MKTRSSVPLFVTLGLLGGMPAIAVAADGQWRQTAVVYIMGAAIDGETQLGDLEVPVDLSISDVFGSLEMGAMGAYRIANDTWSFTVDATFMGLGGTSESERGLVKGDMDLDQVTLMGTAGRRVTEHLEALFSLAYVDLSTDLELRTRNPLTGAVTRRTASEGAGWVDPLLGLHYGAPFADRWQLNLRGDVGGFGIGADLTWQLLANVHWQATDTVGVAFGYRAISFDYEDGKGSDYERYDLIEQGPLVGLTIAF